MTGFDQLTCSPPAAVVRSVSAGLAGSLATVWVESPTTAVADSVVTCWVGSTATVEVGSMAGWEVSPDRVSAVGRHRTAVGRWLATWTGLEAGCWPTVWARWVVTAPEARWVSFGSSPEVAPAAAALWMDEAPTASGGLFGRCSGVPSPPGSGHEAVLA